MNNIINALNWRYATKSFDPSKKLSDEQLDTILESMRLSASSYGLQPWKFIVVSNPETRTALRAAAWDQTQVTDASVFIVLTVRTDVDAAYVDAYMKSIADARGMDVSALAGFADMIKGTISRRTAEQVIDWSSRQVYIALGTALTTAAQLEVDACPMEGFDESKFDEILGLKEKGLTSRVCLALGFRSAEDTSASYKKVRFAKNEVIVTM
jgi:nitroreductase